MPAAEEHTCGSCGSARERLSTEPISQGYELRTLVCPKRKTTLKFVGKRLETVRRGEIGLKAK